MIDTTNFDIQEISKTYTYYHTHRNHHNIRQTDRQLRLFDLVDYRMVFGKVEYDKIRRLPLRQCVCG